MKIYIGADHGGFKLKDEIKNSLRDKDFEILDLGNSIYDEEDDYPDFALPVAKKVAEDFGSFGILLCKSGVGVNIVANKVKGIRSALGFDKTQIRKAREDDDINLLALPADFLDKEQAIGIIEEFIQTSFKKGEKYKRRIEKITDIENGI